MCCPLPKGHPHLLQISSSHVKPTPPTAGAWRPMQLRRMLKEEEGYHNELGPLVDEIEELSERDVDDIRGLFVSESTIIFLKSHSSTKWLSVFS